MPRTPGGERREQHYLNKWHVVSFTELSVNPSEGTRGKTHSCYDYSVIRQQSYNTWGRGRSRSLDTNPKIRARSLAPHLRVNQKLESDMPKHEAQPREVEGRSLIGRKRVHGQAPNDGGGRYLRSAVEVEQYSNRLAFGRASVVTQTKKMGRGGGRYTISIGVLAHPLDWLSRLDCSTTKRVLKPKRAVFERSRRELSLDVRVGAPILLIVEQSSVESQSRGCAKPPILTVDHRPERQTDKRMVNAK